MKNIIRVIRGSQVILDADLARLYGVETKRLNEQVRRNIERFPEDFMFQLTKEEASRLQIVTSNNETGNLKSQFVTSSEDEKDTKNLMSQIATSSWGGHRKLPYAFTEQGIAMLSGILRSPTAIEANIRIMRAFVEMRHFIAGNSNVFNRINILEQRQVATENKIDHVFSILEKNDNIPKQGIYFEGQIYDAYNFVSELICSAGRSIVLIDNYVDNTVLTMLDKRGENVSVEILTSRIGNTLQLDLERHNAQYPPITISCYKKAHDRFLFIDDKVYHIGASIKDLGKKLFGFSLMKDLRTEEILSRII